jgi:GNAT superfamily N-acetyltransferase
MLCRASALVARGTTGLRTAMPIREMNRSLDRRGVEAIDTSFETSSVYEVVIGPQRIELALRELSAPIVKRYPIADAFAPWCSWDTAWVAEDDGKIVGFAAVEYEAWHARLVLWHVYVTRSQRRTGVGRALLAQVEAHGLARGAHRVWLETTNVNVPGIAAYAQLGYTLCGLDVTEYDTLPYADEAAVYLAKRLA